MQEASRLVDRRGKMFAMGVTVDMKDVERLVRAGHPAYTRGGAAGINRVLGKVRTVTKRESAGKLRMPQKVLNKRIKLYRAKPYKLQGYLRVYTLDMALHHLDPVEGRKGVVAKGGRYYHHGFFVNTENSTKPISSHEPYRRKGSPRLPIEKIKVPIRVVVEPTLDRATAAFTGAEFNRVLWQQIEWRLNKGM